MQEWFSRLRAVLTPQALALLAALLLLAGGMMTREDHGVSSLERRIERTLSSMDGAGRVRVVVRMQTREEGGIVSSGKAQQTEICGAVAVASGADDPLVKMELQEALCALLGLPPSAVNVMTGGE